MTAAVKYGLMLTREQIEAKRERLLWMMSGQSVPPPDYKLTLEQELALCDMALRASEVRAGAIEECAIAAEYREFDEAWSSQYDAGRKDAAERIRALSPAPAARQGWKWVPIEITREMAKAFFMAHGDADALQKISPVHGTGNGDLQMDEEWVNTAIILRLAERYIAMINAAPSDAATKGGV